jgi:hypothetical protein
MRHVRPANWSGEPLPVDAPIFARRCTCDLRTSHMASTPEGLHDILRTATFAELNMARAIGGAVTMLASTIREAAWANPADENLKASARLYSSTFFRGFLRAPAKVDPERRPETIVSCTLLFLYSCDWLRSGAALLAALARQWMSAVGEARLLTETRNTRDRAVVCSPAPLTITGPHWELIITTQPNPPAPASASNRLAARSDGPRTSRGRERWCAERAVLRVVWPCAALSAASPMVFGGRLSG